MVLMLNSEEWVLLLCRTTWTWCTGRGGPRSAPIQAVGKSSTCPTTCTVTWSSTQVRFTRRCPAYQSPCPHGADPMWTSISLTGHRWWIHIFVFCAITTTETFFSPLISYIYIVDSYIGHIFYDIWLFFFRITKCLYMLCTLLFILVWGNVFICCACELSPWDSEKRLFDSFVFLLPVKKILTIKLTLTLNREKGLNTVALPDNLLENGLESP